MKTAIIVNGVCRQTLLPSLSWDKFPIKADWFLTTWDYSQATYSPNVISAGAEITRIAHRFSDIVVEDYLDYHANFIATDKIHPMFRSFHLLNKIRNQILDKGYQRIILTRPDLYLDYRELLTDEDFTVDDNSIKILGMHEPETFISHDKKEMEDQFLCMSEKTFRLVSDMQLLLSIHRRFKYYGDIHKFVYHFFKQFEIKVEPISKMRSILVRADTEEYYKQHNEITFEKMTEIFMHIYRTKDLTGVGKFWRHFNKIVIQVPDMEKIRISQKTGGILKLRKQ